MHAKHTPGPWEFDEFNEISCAENGYPVARVPFASSHLRGVAWAEAMAGIRANLRLISAAPDLLDALQMAKHIVAREGTDEQMQQVFAAIEKATGEQA